MFVLTGLAVLLLIGLAAYAIMNVDMLLENLILVVLVVMSAIFIIVVVIYLLMAILALPYYAAKGETYQTNVDYDLGQVESVKERDSEDSGKKE